MSTNLLFSKPNHSIEFAIIVWKGDIAKEIEETGWGKEKRERGEENA